MFLYAIGVDKNELLVGEGSKFAAFGPHETAAKSYCVRCRILQEWDCHITALTEL